MRFVDYVHHSIRDHDVKKLKEILDPSFTASSGESRRNFNINKSEDFMIGRSPLIYAIYRAKNSECENEEQRKNSIEIIKILIENGADINIQNKNGTSALIFACENNNFDMVKFLIDNNVDINSINKNGKSAIDITNNPEIKKILNF